MYISIYVRADNFQGDCTNYNRLPRTTATFNAIVESASSEATKVCVDTCPCVGVLCT